MYYSNHASAGSPIETYSDDSSSQGSLSRASPIYPSYAEVPLAKSLRQREATSSPVFHTLAASCSPLELPASSLPVSPTAPSAPHIPRPPNAFMVYRSELIKSGRIPQGVEHRQQNISRLAGECWNLLTEDEKGVYRKKAADALEEHKRLNPNYKFTPAPRGSRRSKAKSQSDDPNDAKDHIRNIRETYVGVIGPSLVAPRRRKRQSAKDRTVEKDKTPSSSSQSSPQVDSNPGLVFSGPSSPESAPSPMTIGSDSQASGFYHPFPQASLPRRPSTSLGFIPNPTPSTHNSQPPTFNNPFVNDARTFVAPALGLSSVLQSLDIAASGLPEVPFPGVPLPQIPVAQLMPGFDFTPFAPTTPYDFIVNAQVEFTNMNFADPQQQQMQHCHGADAPRHFGLHFRSVSEDAVSPLDTSPMGSNYHMMQRAPPTPSSSGWTLVNNPADEFNYAVDGGYTTPPSTAISLHSPK